MARGLKFRGIVLYIYVAKISCAVTAQLICISVFTYAKSRFCHDTAHMEALEITSNAFEACLSSFQQLADNIKKSFSSCWEDILLRNVIELTWGFFLRQE